MKYVSAVFIAVFASMCFAPLSTGAQDINSESKPANVQLYECHQLYTFAVKTMPVYYDAGQIDSIRWLAKFWHGECQERHPSLEVLTRIWLLMAVYDHRLDALPISKDIIKNISVYSSYYKSALRYFAKHPTHKRSYLGSKEYESMTVRLAQDLLNRPDLSSAEELICRIYSGDTTISPDKLRGEMYRDTRLQTGYTELHNNRSGFGARLSAGCWVPMGARAELGAHPNFGLAVGVEWYKAAFYIAYNDFFSYGDNPYITYHGPTADTVSEFKLKTAEGQFIYKFWKPYPHEF